MKFRRAFEQWIEGAGCALTTRIQHEENARAIEVYFGIGWEVEDFTGPAGGELAALFLQDQTANERKPHPLTYATARSRLGTLWRVLEGAGIRPERWPIPRPGAEGHANRARYVMGPNAARVARAGKRPAKHGDPRVMKGPRWNASCVCATCGDEHHARASIPSTADLYDARTAVEGFNAEDQRRWDNQIGPQFGHRSATSIEPQEIQDHLNRRRSERDERGVPSEGELKHEIGLLRRVLAWGVDQGRIPHTRIAKLRELPRSTEVTQRLTPADVARLVDAADDAKAVFILLHFDCLLSKSEVQALHWEDVIDDWTALRVEGREKPVVLESARLRARMQSLKEERVSAGDPDPRVLKSSHWYRDIRKLTFRVLGDTKLNGESISSAMFLRSGLLAAARESRSGYALEESAGRKRPLRERRLVRNTPSEANAILEQHQAGVAP